MTPDALDLAKLAAIVSLLQALGAVLVIPAALWWLDKRYARLAELNAVGTKLNTLREDQRRTEGKADEALQAGRELARRLQDHRDYSERHLIEPIRELMETVARLREEMAAARERDEAQTALLRSIQAWAHGDDQPPTPRRQ